MWVAWKLTVQDTHWKKSPLYELLTSVFEIQLVILRHEDESTVIIIISIPLKNFYQFLFSAQPTLILLRFYVFHVFLILFTLLRIIISPITWRPIWDLISGASRLYWTWSLAQRLKVLPRLWKRLVGIVDNVARRMVTGSWHRVPAWSRVQRAHLGLTGQAGSRHGTQLL